MHLLPEGVWPTTAATLGANTALLQVTVDPDAGRMVVVGAIDNLTKGTAGAAVQCMNLAARAARDHRPADDRSEPRDRRRGPGRVPGRRSDSRAEGQRQAPTSRSSSTTGRAFAAAGVFTRNKVKAAPVLWSEQVLATGSLRAVVLNSGGANACTGHQGFQTAHATAEAAAELLGCGAIEVAVCSTGLIGEQLPKEKCWPGSAPRTPRWGPTRRRAAPRPARS